MKRKINEDQCSENSDTDTSESSLVCTLCSKKLKNMKTLKQHMASHTTERKCEFCDKSYARTSELNIHKKKIHGIQNPRSQNPRSQNPSTFVCDVCKKTFGKKYNLQRHTASVHQRQRPNQTRFTCRHCECEFQNYNDLFDHIEQNHPLNQHGGRRKVLFDSTLTNKKQSDERLKNNTVHTSTRTSVNEPDKETTNSDLNSLESDSFREDETALRNGVLNRNLYPSNNERYDVLTFFSNVRERVRALLESRARQQGGIKWNLCVQVEMQRDDGPESITSTPYFRSRTYIKLPSDDSVEHNLNEAMQKIYASLEEYMREGSGWYVNKVLKLEIHTVVYKPLGGSSYMSLPKTLLRSGSLLNIYNKDDKCFLYCILASLHPAINEPERVEHYIRYEQELNMSGISFPVIVSQIHRVENQNKNISVNVFTYEDSSIMPLRITEHTQRQHHVNLLWLKRQENAHYFLITDLNRFLSRTKSHRSQHYFCPYCLHGFTENRLLQEHQPYCSIHGAQKVDLPIPGKTDILEFTEYEKTLKVPFVIYADFETINVKIDTCTPNPDQSSTTPTSRLEVCGFGYKVVCEDKRYTKPTVVYRGSDASYKLLECLLKEQEEIENILNTIEPMNLSHEDQVRVENAIQCCLCNQLFTEYDKTYGRVVRHHNHLTGKFIGMTHNRCNINCGQAKFTCVIFHNLKNFDSHILCETMGLFKNERLKCIAQNAERYISFSLGNLRFLDSFQFLPSSLETLVSDLAQDGLDTFPHLLSEFEDREDAELLLRKGVYPYDYMDSFEKFSEQQLPIKESFYSSIKREHISEKDYDHALTVFSHFGLSSLGDYHDLYLKTDVILLCEVFESFRDVCMKQYGLDACNFYTSPGLSWTSCLKMTGVKLELLTDIDMVLMIEAGIRGGLSQISNRYKKANNPYLQDYDSCKPLSYLQYLDANNLYGWAMIQPLPVGDFAFLDEIGGFDVMTVSESGKIGYILEVSLHYPPELHDLHNCLPLAPEQKLTSNEQLSPYAQQLLRKLHGLEENDALPTRGKVGKLLATLEDKDHYVLHYRILQLYVRLGMKIKTIHRILRFRQESWMKPYIDFNTEMRKKAKSTFQKNFYKLMNVSVFGKTMENVRKHKNIELIHTEKRLQRVAAKATYKNTIVFNEDLVAAEMFRTRVNLNKPSYSGMCILDLSKYLMYDFWYNYIKKKYGNRASLQMTDTDSLLFFCETEDIYHDMKDALELFDTSDYPSNHPLHSQRNKKELGKMKDETNGTPISEFVGLRSKMYSFVCNNKEEKRAKGIARAVVKKVLKHEHYKNVLFDESCQTSFMTALRSHRHKLFCETITKTGLSSFDDKRYLLNATESLAYGHYKIKTPRVCDENCTQESTSAVQNNNSEQVVFQLKEDNYFQTLYEQLFTLSNHVETFDDEYFMLEDFKVTPCTTPI